MTRRYQTTGGQHRRVTAGVAIIVLAAIIVAAIRLDQPTVAGRLDPPAAHAVLSPLPHTPGSYLGVYAAHGSVSYGGVTAFTRTTGVTPDVVTYYSTWFEPFRASFATAAARHGAVPLI